MIIGRYHIIIAFDTTWYFAFVTRQVTRPFLFKRTKEIHQYDCFSEEAGVTMSSSVAADDEHEEKEADEVRKLFS